MRPVSLTLTGFCGIRAGLGRETLHVDLHALPEDAHLVAIAGANGRGKSTLMDNLHPYLCLPSRGGMGGSAYYEHVYLPESEKDLVWAHAGQRYRSQVVIRLNGRRRTEAYLWLDVAGRWQPLELADGTRSDGKLETYQRCVEAVCGRAETFFTAMFSAQGKRPLSDYRNADIKILLADLLGLAQLRTLGEQARDTARLLKAGLQVLQHEQAAAGDAAQRVATQRHAAARAGGEHGAGDRVPGRVRRGPTCLRAGARRSAGAATGRGVLAAPARTARRAVAGDRHVGNGPGPGGAPTRAPAAG